MLKTLEFNRTAENEIQRFLEECESFNGKNMSDCAVYAFFQGKGLGAQRVLFGKPGDDLYQLIIPFDTIFRIVRNGESFPVSTVDNRNVGKFSQGK